LQHWLLVRGRGDAPRGFRRHEGLAPTVFEQVEVIDNAPVRQGADPVQKLVHRQADQVDELHAAFVGTECLPRLGDPVRIRLRPARHDGDATDTRLKAQGDVQRRLQVHLHRIADDTGAEPPCLHLPLFDGAEDDGNTREQLSAKLQQEIQRRGQPGNDDIDLPAGILLAEELRQLPLITILRKPRRI